MNSALRIATFFNIPVRVHWSFLLIFVYVLYTGSNQGWDIANMTWSLIFVLALFGCVVLHEFGHALTARRFGVETRDIILSPIGGVARLNKLPEKPLQEFLVAIAGPLVNVAIALFLAPYLLTMSGESRQMLFKVLLDPDGNYFPVGLSQLDYFLAGLILLNVMLALFNMIPAFPMDGGRVLRALLSIRLERHRATQIAAYIGQGLAVLFIGYGLFVESNIFYLLIGGFVFMAAAGEYRMVRTQRVLQQYTVRDVARTEFTRLYLGDTIEKAIARLSNDGQRSYIVFDIWQEAQGILGEKQLKKAHEARDYDAPVEKYMTPLQEGVLMDDTLRRASEQFSAMTVQTLPVYTPQGQVAGILDTVSLDRFMRFVHKK